jgi:hypothetical protein
VTCRFSQSMTYCLVGVADFCKLSWQVERQHGRA